MNYEDPYKLCIRNTALSQPLQNIWTGWNLEVMVDKLNTNKNKYILCGNIVTKNNK
jgi:hypothetical protein